MQRVDCGSSNQALFMSVYADRIVLSRRNVRHDCEMGPDWAIPLPSPDGSCTESSRGKNSAAPAFPPDAKATVSEGIGKDRAKKERAEVVVSFPPAHSADGRPRVFDYGVIANAPGFRLTRRVFFARAYWAEAFETEPSRCIFGQFELPPDKAVEFTVRPANSYGTLGEPLPPVTWQKS